jgi:hypothetical protein
MAERPIRELFKEGYSAKSMIERIALARSLLDAVSSARKQDPVDMFVLLREARDIAAAAGDLETSFKACKAMALSFRIGLDHSRDEALNTARKTWTASIDAASRSTLSLLRIADASSARYAFDEALKWIDEARRAAKASRDPGLSVDVHNKSADIMRLKEWHAAAKSAELALSAKEDPKFNQILGIYLCLSGGDWERGLPLLASAEDPTLRKAAGAELSRPSGWESEEQAAEAWLAASMRNPERRRECLGRSRHWFEKALEGASGLGAMKIRRRLAAVSEAENAAIGATGLIRIFDPKTDAVAGEWRLTDLALASPAKVGGVPHRAQLPYAPGEEYDVHLDFEKDRSGGYFGLGLPAAWGQFMLIFDGASCGLHLVDGKPFNANETTARAILKDRTRVLCSVRTTRISVRVDGEMAIDWYVAAGRLSFDEGWRIPNEKALFLGSFGSFSFSRIAVVPIHGRARLLR